MTREHVRHKFCISIVAIVVAAFACVLLLWFRSIDFVDNPALLTDVSLNGTISLDTKDGVITAALADVTGTVSSDEKQAFDHVVSSAQRDFVAFHVRADNTVDIWYQDADGETRSLNREIAGLCTTFRK
jgi:hypothetical protein